VPLAGAPPGHNSASRGQERHALPRLPDRRGFFIELICVERLRSGALKRRRGPVSLPGMASDTARFEITMQSERRRQLDELASATGISSADLARLAINQMLEERAVRLPAAEEQHVA